MKISFSLRPVATVVLFCLVSLCVGRQAYAGSATWNLNLATNDWNTATNWTPATVPNATTDIATFGESNTTSVLTSANVDLASLVFTGGAPPYTIATDRALFLTFWGEGVRNDSGVQQTFTGGFSFNGTSSAGDQVAYDSGIVSFNDNASAGSASFGEVGIDLFDNASADQGIFTNASIIFHNNSTAANGIFTAGLGKDGAGGKVTFLDTASAGDATFSIFKLGTMVVQGGTLGQATVTANGGAPSGFNTTIFIQFSATADHATLIANGGVVPGTTSTKGDIFFDSGSTAAEATIVINPTAVTGAAGGSADFFRGASASNSNITVNGAAVTGSIAEALLTFSGGQNTTAANATIVATGGSNDGNGGLVQFLSNAGGGTCRIELLGNSRLDVDAHRDVDLTIGSLEGEGTVTVSGHTGGSTLNIGSNNLSTTFSGLIEDGLLVGAIAKIGIGTLTLSGANTYGGGTTVSSGVLLVSNISGSGTGTGAVSVDAGTLGGSGIIAGPVTVGTNTGVQAFLAPSKGAKKPATLTIQSALTLNDDSTYIYKLDTKRVKADEVLANGVTIDTGAKFSFRPSGNNALTVGQVFTVISNTAATPIAGAFHNLPEGKIITVNGSNLQASYTGGDGNDLTLTVVP